MSKELKIAKMADWIHKGTTPSIVFEKYELKTMQRAILNCLQSYDVIANLPTGFGKSLLFQYPASLQKQNYSCILVIVPLKALLWDVIRQSSLLGIVAEQISHNIINEFYCEDKLPQMMIATPQKIFASENTINFLQSLQKMRKIRMLVIDECHCVCEWGHDFRPAYLKLQELRQLLSGVRVLAISATITPDSRVDLSKKLLLMGSYYFQASYHRSNLFYGVIKCKNKNQVSSQLLKLLKDGNMEDQSGIIYCQTIASAQLVMKDLKNLKVGLFHSKLSENLRKQTYDKFMDGRIKVLVGTICFGMGINKKDIRYVINIGISKSPQNYYQESGRAGRDGKPAKCLIISYPNQSKSLTFLISKGAGSSRQKSHQLSKISEIMEYVDEDEQCRRVSLFKKLGENFLRENCASHCDICQNSSKKAKNMKQLKVFPQIMRIVIELQITKIQFTKKQLCDTLKGKKVQKKRRGKSLQILGGQNLKGMFKQLKMDVIQKIVDKMIRKNLLIHSPKTLRSKYLISYYKAANKNATKRVQQFTISICQEEKKQNEKKQDKFGRFLQRKDLVSLKSASQVEAKSKHEIEQAEIINQKSGYEPFLMELFGDEMDPEESNDQIDEELSSGNQAQQQYDQPKFIQQVQMEKIDQREQQSTITIQIKQKKEEILKYQALKRVNISNQKLYKDFI